MRKIMNTVFFKLFSRYSILFAVVLLGCFLIFSAYMSRTMKDSIQESNLELANYISWKMDKLVSEMDYTSTLVVKSSTLKQTFFSNTALLNAVELYHNESTVYDLLSDIISPTFSACQVNLYSFDGRMVGAGRSYAIRNFRPDEIENFDWYNPVTELNGRIYISVPHDVQWALNVRERVISLYRVFSSAISSSRKGAIEVQMKYFTVTEAIAKALSDADGKSVYIFNSRAERIYPFAADDKSGYIYEGIKEYIADSKAGSLTLHYAKGNNKTDLISYTKSDYTDWMVVLAEPASSSFDAVIGFQKIIYTICAFVVFLTLILTYYISKQITRPIKAMHDFIDLLDIGGLEAQDEHGGTKLNELEELKLAYQKMRLRVNRSVDDLIESRNQEMKSRMLALQSQMNPHFLYNMLCNLEAMSEDDGSQRVATACEDLSDMLRYILREADNRVEMSEELWFTDKYVGLMKLRFGDNFQVNIDIDDELNNIIVPRLIVQPIIENCMKYGTSFEPPWIINVRGRVAGNRWILRISDNGAGFSDESLASVRSVAANPGKFVGAGNFDLAHMGMINIYLRLSLLYKERAVFRVYNGKNGGAIVTIGGPMIRREVS
ncbi:MAG: histidine kinase [Bacillota bacterium]